VIIFACDTETTGLNPETDRIIEFGYALWDTGLRRITAAGDFFMKLDVDIPDETWAEAEAIHGIPKSVVMERGSDPKTLVKFVKTAAKSADAWAAHNGSGFDRPFVDNWFSRYPDVLPDFPKPLWIDTRLDLPKPVQGKLTHIAADHNFLNPFAHCALADVLTMLKILDCYDLEKVVERARIPNITISAVGLPFARKDEARDRGYYWRPEEKLWKKVIKQCDLEKEKAEAGFTIAVDEDVQKAFGTPVKGGVEEWL
jgi:DNA polymerase-3 subunit epsilon